MSTLKFNYRPRAAFIGFHKRRQRFACLVCHRRAGKTVASVNDLQDRVLRCKHPSPRFAYVAPFLKQAKNVAWDYLRAAAAPLKGKVDANGKPLDAEINEAELKINYHNGGSLRLYGADNPDALRGIYLDGVVMDEYADMDPRVWPEIIRPMLGDRMGWAVHIGTPRGRNAFYSIFKSAQENSDWYSLVLKASESGIIPADELASIRETQTEDQYAQEYECSFDAAVHGTFYAKLLNQARNDNRIGSVPYDPSVGVWVSWDLGVRDATALWFAQVVGREVHIIDYYEASGYDLGHYVQKIRERPYVYEKHILPHDAEARELGTGKTRVETLSSLGLTQYTVLQRQRPEDGINAARLLIPKCYFDAKKCDRGLEALMLHRADVDDRFVDPVTKAPILKGTPVHDWTSHAADSFRYLALGIDDKGISSKFNRPIIYPKRGWA